MYCTHGVYIYWGSGIRAELGGPLFRDALYDVTARVSRWPLHAVSVAYSTPPMAQTDAMVAALVCLSTTV